ncbi:hypothetical protein [Candidatus Colwellia aromaticivorans]|uniref:hypothetical protein n=1 Tax=Candidatus Colwellia aromaticivorans TaxID=2267621 RepID=UPI000DF2D950|nr:hypothetical protein [Candidatus Colwellia aromaticivorans]
MNIKLLSTFLFTTITACTANTDKSVNNIVTCIDPRPQICTMDYRPVCGLMNENKIKTYSNGCGACSDPKVLSYTDQACQDDSLDKTSRNHELTEKNVWHVAKLRGVSYRAIGQEPAWLLEIINGEHFYISSDYGELVKTYPYVEPKVNTAQRTTVYQLNNDVIIKLEDKNCVDTMSGEAFSTQVNIKWHDRVLIGCGKTLF